MRHSPLSDRLVGLGGAKWRVHQRAKAMQSGGRDVVLLTIGEPACAAAEDLTEAAIASLRAGRTGYSDGQGEPALRAALARRYTASTGREISDRHVLCVPGTQTALYLSVMGLVGSGDEVLVGDPFYATYDGVIRAADAAMRAVPLRPENGFRMTAGDLAQQVTPRSKAILLNTPHNPTGAVLSRKDVLEIGEFARAHDLWIISDEVYEELIFDDEPFASPLAEPGLASRTLVVSSISKSHAAAGFRSGWVIAEPEVVEGLLPLAETMLFGNQPFIADATAAVVGTPSALARSMRRDFARRAALVAEALKASGLHVHVPQAGMFALVRVSATGMSGDAYAMDLLDRHGVAVMPGTSFGSALTDWVRLALTVEDDTLREACARMRRHAAQASGVGLAEARV